MSGPEDEPLSVDVIGGRLVISIGVQTLGFAVANSPDHEGDPIKVTDALEAAKEIRRELVREEEDGTTPVHMLLDKAAFDAWENGGEGFAQRMSGGISREERAGWADVVRVESPTSALILKRDVARLLDALDAADALADVRLRREPHLAEGFVAVHADDFKALVAARTAYRALVEPAPPAARTGEGAGGR